VNHFRVFLSIAFSSAALHSSACAAQMPGQSLPVQPQVQATASATGLEATIGEETMRVTVCSLSLIHIVTRPHGGNA